VQTLDSPKSSNAWPLRIRAPKPSAGAQVRTIRIGILGLGKVGQAVARLAADRTATAHAGLRFHVERALVRDPAKPRLGIDPGRVTGDAAAFLLTNYDVVIEALDAVEPARTLVARLLGRGTSVVTANKALVAAHGAHLESIAAARGAAFRYEATALAAVPFLGTLAARPLGRVSRSHARDRQRHLQLPFDLLAEPGVSFDDALSQRRHSATPSPIHRAILDGLDAADKAVAASHRSLVGDGCRKTRARHQRHSPGDGRRSGSRAIDRRHDQSGGFRRRDATGVRHLSARRSYQQANRSRRSAVPERIRLDGRHVSNLFFSGPGAGPDVTAATLLDDAVQAASFERKIRERPRGPVHPVFPSSPATPWFVRVTFPGVLPGAAAAASLVAGIGLPVERVADHATGNSRWLFIGPQGHRDIDTAIEKLSNTHRVETVAFRRL
jgi:homoserine dehydrogenase